MDTATAGVIQGEKSIREYMVFLPADHTNRASIRPKTRTGTTVCAANKRVWERASQKALSFKSP